MVQIVTFLKLREGLKWYYETALWLTWRTLSSLPTYIVVQCSCLPPSPLVNQGSSESSLVHKIVKYISVTLLVCVWDLTVCHWPFCIVKSALLTQNMHIYLGYF